MALNRHWEPQRSASAQRPFAVILACSDSRAPVETLFDQGIGDLFVVRVAGNVVDSLTLGSVEFAVTQLGCRLVVVLGHTQCGAVTAALESMRTGVDPKPKSLVPITDQIKQNLASGSVLGAVDSVRDAVRANVRATAAALRESGEMRQLVQSRQLRVVEAEYELETGEVRFLG